MCFPLAVYRNNSTKDLEAFADSAVAMNRMMLQHLAISESHTIPQQPKFSIGDLPELSDEDEEVVAPKIIISHPRGSNLARRRALSRELGSIDSGIQSISS